MKLSISIIVPTYNRADQLKDCLTAILYSISLVGDAHFEIIVGDDSTELTTASLVKEQFSDIYLLKGPKKGPAANRNNAAKMAKGDWLIFFDDDCYPKPECIGTYVSVLKEKTAIQVWEGVICPSRPLAHPFETAPIKLEPGSLWSCNFCISREFFNHLGGFDEFFKFPHMEDLDLQKRIQLTSQIGFAAEAIVIHPPRPLPSAQKLGHSHASDVYFAHKHRLSISLNSILKNIFYSRLLPFKNTDFGKYHFKMMALMLTEMYIVCKNYSDWNKNALKALKEYR